MNKFTIKFFIIFFSFISLMFFSLVTFNQHKMEEFMPPEAAFSAMPPPPPPVYIPVIVIGIISFIFIFIVLKYISKNFVEPLEQIKGNIKKIKDGNFETEFKTKSENKEICDTFDVLNEMVEGLKQREKLNDNFIQSIVHDLRAPVVAQERAIEILNDEFEDNPLVKGLVSNNDAFLKMINEFIEAFGQKEIKVEKIRFNLAKLTDSIIEVLKPSAEVKHIEIQNAVNNNFIVLADYLSFNRIIANLISNAIENIENNKIIKISAKTCDNKTIIIVEDNGSGIADVSNIFDKYVSLNKSNKKTVSGLGLAIVADLVKKNDGKISVETEKDKYTKFIIELGNEED